MSLQDRRSNLSRHAVTHNEVIISHSWVAFLKPTYKRGDLHSSAIALFPRITEKRFFVILKSENKRTLLNFYSIMDTLINASVSCSSLKLFFESSTAYKELLKIADAELKAASGVLRGIEYSANKREAINRVLVHLESSHELYLAGWSSYVTEVNIVNATNKGLGLFNFHEMRYKDYFVCCFMSLAHKYLGDHFNLIEEKLIFAEDAITVKSVWNKKARDLDFIKKINILLGLPIFLSAHSAKAITLGVQSVYSAEKGGLSDVEKFVHYKEKYLKNIAVLRSRLI
jgi:hypothetical protein